MPPTPSQTATSTPRLSEFARSFVYPSGIVKTVWPRVESRGRELGLGFDWWQSQAGTVILGYRENGKYACTVGGVGLSIPRQVGKTYFVLAMLFIMCILFPGLQVVWTSHHLRTTTKTLMTARGFARRKKIAPHVRSVRTSHGEGQVEFVNGSAIMFGARSQGFGRGFDEIDVEVFDEAQILDTKALEDMIAAANQSRHEHGALLLFMGTPPRPTDPSDAFRLRRAEALSGESEDAVWLEIGADPASAPDDRSQWPTMNPSFPTRTPEESLLRLRKNLGDDDSWNREGRGVWDPTNTRRVIDETTWGEVADTSSMPATRFVLAVDVNPEQTRASVAFAGMRADGLVHVEIDEHRNGTGWLAQHIVDRCTRNDIVAVVIDEKSPAASLLAEELKRRKVRRVILTDANDMADACAQFYQAAIERTLRHTDQPQVNASLAAASKRALGDRWAWNRKSADADITPIVAVTLAAWGVQSSRIRARDVGKSAGRRVVTW